MSYDPLRERVDALASDLGRVRGRVDPAAAYLFDRIAGHIEVIDSILRPTAAVLYRENLGDGMDDEIAVTKALDVTDRRVLELRRLLGMREAAACAT